MKTVKDLKKFIQDLPDDMPLVLEDWNEDNSWIDVESLYIKKVAFAVSPAIDWEYRDSVIFSMESDKK